MPVIATAGHVDHGKSTLLQALTGTHPDRLAEEQRREMTIDLGFAWTTLDDGTQLSFVDVPGHTRFIANMLGGIGPAPAVLFVVAADEGWQAQSTEHLNAVRALGITTGVVAMTRTDLANDARQAKTLTEIRYHGLDWPVLPVSARTGAGLSELRDALSALASQLSRQEPLQQTELRLWVDRTFTITGAGTVVTGTLGQGEIAAGDQLQILTPSGSLNTTRVRGLQSLGEKVGRLAPTTRVAVNLAGLAVDDVPRGSVLLTPGAWHLAREVDVRLGEHDEVPRTGITANLHLGTTSGPARVRILHDNIARLTLTRPLPLRAGDRAILNLPEHPGRFIGVRILDPDPPALTRRGQARERATALERTDARDLSEYVRGRGLLAASHAHKLGLIGQPATDIQPLAAGWVSQRFLDEAAARLVAALQAHTDAQPLQPSLSEAQAQQVIGAGPDLAAEILQRCCTATGLTITDGRVGRPGPVDFGPAEAGLQQLETMLAEQPFEAPDRPTLDRLGLNQSVVASAVKAGRLLRISPDIVVLPDAAEQAVARLSSLPQPFTAAQAKQALDTTRRVAIPLLEYLDRRRLTRRLDSSHRVVNQP